VSVKAGATTTTVTIKQDAAVDAASQAAVAGATEVASVKFVAVEEGDKVTVGGLTFKAAKDLTAAEVAQAFANLASGAVKPTNLVTPTAATATGDTQGSSAYANGTFTGSLLEEGWSSAAASGDTVVFTATANKEFDDLLATGATATTTTQGKDAVSAKNTLGVVAGGVSITGAAALATVTVDGYGVLPDGGSSTIASNISGNANTSLEPSASPTAVASTSPAPQRPWV